MKKNCFLLLLMSIYFSFLANPSYAQDTKNEYKGDWEICSTWAISNCNQQPGYVDLNNTTVNVRGYVSRNGNLSFTNNGNLNILSDPTVGQKLNGDTLVVYGDLVFKNNANLNINSYAVVVVTGNLVAKNGISIAANGSIVVVGDLTVDNNSNCR